MPPWLSQVAVEQNGVVIRSQAQRSGLSRHAIDRFRHAGDWQLLAPGVYLTQPGTVPWMSRAWAGVLLGGSESALAYRSAAVLLGLAEGEPLPIHVLVPHRTRLIDRPWVRFQRQRDGIRLSSAAARPARTRIEDTVIDLCAAGEPAEVISWITKAVQRRLTTPAHLLSALRARHAVRHRDLIEQVLSDAAAGVHSQLEYRFGRDVAKSHGLPPGQRQFRISATKRVADVG